MGIWNVIQIISPQKNIKYTDVTCTYITDYLGNTILQKMYCSCTVYLYVSEKSYRFRISRYKCRDHPYFQNEFTHGGINFENEV